MTRPEQAASAGGLPLSLPGRPPYDGAPRSTSVFTAPASRSSGASPMALLGSVVTQTGATVRALTDNRIRRSAGLTASEKVAVIVTVPLLLALGVISIH